jgi:hypothetical protein
LLVFFVQAETNRSAKTGCNWVWIKHRRFKYDEPVLEGLAGSHQWDLVLLTDNGQVSLARIRAQEFKFGGNQGSERKTEDDGGDIGR